jgi:hypothetical protein
MGRYARTLILVAAMVLAGDAAARADVKLRVEGMPPNAAPNSLVPRRVVSPQAYTSPAYTSPDYTCAADSALAALNAAVGPNGWQGTYDTATHVLTVTRIGPLSAPPGPTPAWSWGLYVDQSRQGNPCTASVPSGAEALFFPQCTDPTRPSASCYTGGPLYSKIGDSGELYPIAPVKVSYYRTPVAVFATLAENAKIGPTTGATVTTDEGASFKTNDEKGFGVASVQFANGGVHTLWLTQGGKVPEVVSVCATDGGDGFCGSPKTTPPDTIPYGDSPCETNGHDGRCGTIDTSGPFTTVTNIAHKQAFAKKKAPGRVAGDIANDPASVRDVMLRLTRVSTARVRVKTKKRKGKKAKPRYKTVKRCTAWDDKSALFVSARCGTKNAKWFAADLDDLVQHFSYSFALRLPPGTYTLETQSHDLDGHPDDVVVGRTVLTFTVKTR